VARLLTDGKDSSGRTSPSQGRHGIGGKGCRGGRALASRGPGGRVGRWPDVGDRWSGGDRDQWPGVGDQGPVGIGDWVRGPVARQGWWPGTGVEDRWPGDDGGL
jgi:hypothetical protein